MCPLPRVPRGLRAIHRNRHLDREIVSRRTRIGSRNPLSVPGSPVSHIGRELQCPGTDIRRPRTGAVAAPHDTGGKSNSGRYQRLERGRSRAIPYGFHRLPEDWIAQHQVVHANLQATRGALRGKLVALLHRRGEGLLDQHMASQPHGIQGNTRMSGRWRGDRDDILVPHRLKGRVRSEIEAGGHRLCAHCVKIRDPDDLDLGQALQRLNMELTDVAAPTGPDADVYEVVAS